MHGLFFLLGSESFSSLFKITLMNFPSFHLYFVFDLFVNVVLQFYKNLSKSLKDIVWKADPLEGESPPNGQK